jgi:N-acetylglucosaminyldiphosphoundecaprenol N-acetyl-beta-D-mannosaminyltransferase
LESVIVTENPLTERVQESFEVLGVRFSAVQIPDVIERIEQWITTGHHTHCVFASNVHSVVESQRNAHFKETLNTSDLNVPDGMPIILLGRSRGHRLARRVYGPDLFLDFCRETQGKSYRHFFYGGTPEVLESLVSNLKARFPAIQLAGCYAPPFRSLTRQEELHVTELVNQSQADVLWVGLGCPKQELWMQAHRDSINVPAMIGIGQAFDIFAGRTRQAPRWMRENGLEWLFRLKQEPRRLWQRYLIYNTEFVLRMLIDTFLSPASSSSTPRS